MSEKNERDVLKLFDKDKEQICEEIQEVSWEK